MQSATATCRRPGLQISVRCMLLDLCQRMVWLRSGWPMAAAASSMPIGWHLAIVRSAHRAYCAYNAGVPPQMAKCSRSAAAAGTARRSAISSGEPAVVKLRDAAGHSAASVFVAAGATTALTDLPDGVYRPDFAVGELWSRACGTFTAGMRAQRFAGFGSLSGLSPLVIPPELSAAAMPVDIPDQTFEQE